MNRMKKMLIICVLVIGFWICGVGNTDVYAATNKYDSNASINYAKEHCEDDEEDGYLRKSCKYNWLCAEFVSNCLKAGGVNIYDATVVGLDAKLREAGYKREQLTSKQLSISSSGYASIKVSEVPKLKKGDVIINACANPRCGNYNRMVHATIYSGDKSDDGYAKIYSHHNRNINKKACLLCNTCKNSAYTKVYVYYMNGSMQERSSKTNEENIIYKLSTTFKVKCTSKILRANPFVSAAKKDTIYKGEEIKVVGYLYNSYGNLWYKTSKGYYVAHNDLEYVSGDVPKSDYISKTIVVDAKNKSIRETSYGSSKVIKKVQRGTIIEVKGIVTNKYGTNWFYTKDGNYIYMSDYLVVNDLSAEFEAMSVKTLRKAPYASSASAGKLNIGDKVKVRGYVHRDDQIMCYITNDNKFVFAEGLNLVSNGKVPSGYLNNYYIADASQKRIQCTPQSNAVVLDILLKGEKVKITGYVENTRGEIWYIVSGGGYIYSNGLLEVNNTNVNYIITCSEKEKRFAPYSECYSGENVSKFETVKVTGYVYNSYGNLWFLLSDGTYLYADCMKYFGAENVTYNDCNEMYVVDLGDKLVKNVYYETGNTVGVIPEGSRVNVLGKVINKYGNIWYKVSYNGETCYIHNSRLTKTN